MIFDIAVMLKLEHDVDIVDLLHIDSRDTAIRIDRIDRHHRVVHLMRKAMQVQTEDFVYTPHRIVVILGQSHIVNGHMLTVRLQT